MLNPNYKDSIFIAEKISKYWNIPLLTCKDDCSLIIKQNSLSDYYIVEEKIAKTSILKKLGIVIIYIILFCLLAIILGNFMTLKIKQREVQNFKKDHFYGK